MRIRSTAIPRRRALALVAATGLMAVAALAERPALADPAAGTSPDSARAGYRLGVFPLLPPLALDRMFQPIVESLSGGLQAPVHLRTKQTFEMFAEEVARGGYDFILAHPFLYVDAADGHGYLPIVRLADPLVAVVFTRADSPRQRLADVRGVTLGLPPPMAAVSEMVKSELLEAGLVPGQDVQLRHFASKMSCLHAVAIGNVEACGLPRFVLAQLDLTRSREFKIVHESRPIANIVFAVHPRVPEADRRRFRDVVVGWPDSAEGRAILAGAEWSGFVDARDQDYDEIRSYNRRLRQQASRQP
jgi:phosphonate transport system substrate-binding protein